MPTNLDAATLRAELLAALKIAESYMHLWMADNTSAAELKDLELVEAAIAHAAAPRPVACKYGDTSCPCQDGDPCHYEDATDTKAMQPPTAPPPPAEACACGHSKWRHQMGNLGTWVHCVECGCKQYQPPPPAEAREDAWQADDGVLCIGTRDEDDFHPSHEGDVFDLVAALRAQVQALEQERDTYKEHCGRMLRNRYDMDVQELRAKLREAEQATRAGLDRAIALVEEMYATPYGHVLYLDRTKVLAALRAARDGE